MKSKISSLAWRNSKFANTKFFLRMSHKFCVSINYLFVSQFKSTSNKNVSVVGWMVMMADDPEHPDLFLLTDSEKGESLE